MVFTKTNRNKNERGYRMKSLPTPYQDFIHKSRYARWNEKDKRREDWDETVDRYLEYVSAHIKKEHDFDIDGHNVGLYSSLRNHILDLKVMPSMRAMMTAGDALERDNICGYNCSYIPVDHPRAFDECMYILMCGTGVGFSVERENVDKLPVIAEKFHNSDTVITVADSRMGVGKVLQRVGCIALFWADSHLGYKSC